MLEKIKPFFTHAKRVALLARNNEDSQWYHIFSVIELLPEDIPGYNIPTRDWYRNRIIRSELTSESDAYSIYLLVTDLTVDAAINCFNDPLANIDFDGHANHYFNKSFVREPAGDSPYVLPPNLYEQGLGEILPKRNSGLLAWTQIDSLRETEKRFKSDGITNEMKAMSQLTSDWLGFDMWRMSEHIGNIYLSIPNPYYRDLDKTLSRNPMGIMYHLKRRKGINEQLSISVTDKHGDIIALDKRFEIKEDMGILELPHDPQLVQFKVYNSDGDLIGLERPAAFLRELKIDMQMKQVDYKVKVQSDKGNSEFVVEKFSKGLPVKVGSAPDFNPHQYFKKAVDERKHEYHTESKEFIFYPGGKTAEDVEVYKSNVKEDIRAIINKSEETCYLCDPYFSAKDLIDYAYHIRHSFVKIRVLNSKQFISKPEAKLLQDAIDAYNQAPFEKIECRILKGEKSILHDRFIICDTKVWYLGSSFNEFGNRATCIARVPESSDTLIVKEIEKWYLNSAGEFSESLKDYCI